MYVCVMCVCFTWIGLSSCWEAFDPDARGHGESPYEASVAPGPLIGDALLLGSSVGMVVEIGMGMVQRHNFKISLSSLDLLTTCLVCLN